MSYDATQPVARWRHVSHARDLLYGCHSQLGIYLTHGVVYVVKTRTHLPSILMIKETERAPRRPPIANMDTVMDQRRMLVSASIGSPYLSIHVLLLKSLMYCNRWKALFINLKVNDYLLNDIMQCSISESFISETYFGLVICWKYTLMN